MINYKHLYYFWVVAKAGGVTRASERLHLTPQTISGQLSLLEEHLGESLFSRVGRNLELTEVGRMVLSYAEDIFSLGSELKEMLRNLPDERPLMFNVGVTDVVPKSIAYRLLAPVLESLEPIRIVCKEGTINSLLDDLAVHRLDLVIADGPIPLDLSVSGFSRPLGDCGVTFFATPELADKLGSGFPGNLSGMPLLLPGEMTVVRDHLVQWLGRLHIHPRVIGEFDDSALMKAFGQAGVGVFIAPAAIAGEVEKQYGVMAVGQTNDVRAEFYAISVERKTAHPAVALITETAREWLFTNPLIAETKS
ncbi:MAG: transcriptional activator NhaR [Porticoccus sp.]|nr:transcriptional activator NhaR [Porticoccus sp.]